MSSNVASNGKFSPRALTQRLLGAREGTAAIEFALLAVPYFMIIFAIVETCLAFVGEQVLDNATETMARRIRTGQITVGTGNTTDLSREEFRAAFCAEISIVISCSPAEITTPQKLWLDVRSFTSYNAIPKGIPRVSSDPFADIDTKQFAYAPGGAGTINIVRAYYRWQIMTDLVRPYITNIRPPGGKATDFLIVGTAAFLNE